MIDHSEILALQTLEPQHIAYVEHGVHRSAPAVSKANDQVVVIDRRPFIRECLVRSLTAETHWTVVAFDTIATWRRIAKHASASLIILSIGNEPLQSTGDITLLKEIASKSVVAVMADGEAPAAIVGALDLTCRGYIPTSLPLNVAIEALRLVRAGGVYVPAGSLIASQRTSFGPRSGMPQATPLFTSRQREVIECLRTGKANKVIAHDLNMRESTVKVHVRNIMRKLKARNRTEVAYLAGSQLSNGTH